jgi:hypothetical protein
VTDRAIEQIFSGNGDHDEQACYRERCHEDGAGQPVPEVVDQASRRRSAVGAIGEGPTQ